MIGTSYLLYKKKRDDGKKEVILRINLTARNRPCFKSGVYIDEKYFKSVKLTGYGNQMGIVPPKQSKLNFKEVKEVTEAKSQLDNYTLRILKICQIAEQCPDITITKEWIEKSLLLVSSLKTDEITLSSLLEVKKNQTNKALQKHKTIYQLGEEYLDSIDCSKYHKQAFRVLLRDIARYELFVQKTINAKFKITVENMTKEIVENLLDYIENEYLHAQKNPILFQYLLTQCPIEITHKHKKFKVQRRGDNTILKFKKKLRSFYNWLNKNDITDNNPMKTIVVGSEKNGEPIYISVKERDTIANHDFGSNKALEVQRDIFIFHCLTGPRIGDLIKFTEKNIVEDKYLTYLPHKTKDEQRAFVVKVPLTETCLKLIEKYRGVDKKGRLFPFISCQKYNEALKKIFTACDITRNVSIRNGITKEYELIPINKLASSHMGRKTFIGAAYNEVQDPSIVSKMSGHVENSKAFARYRNIEESVLENVISKIEISNNKDNKNDLMIENFKSLDNDSQLLLLSQMAEIVNK